MKTLMTLARLLTIFETVDDAQLVYPPTPAILERIAQTSAIPHEYVRMADEAFALLNGDHRRESEFIRFTEILRVMLYVDGRTERALLRVAELTHGDEETAFLAINALSALANYYRGCRSTIEREPLEEQLQSYVENQLLANNALACLRYLRRGESIP